MWIFKILFLKNIFINTGKYVRCNFKWQKQYNNYKNPPVSKNINTHIQIHTHTHRHTHLEKILRGFGCPVWWHYGQLFCKCHSSGEEAVAPLDSKLPLAKLLSGRCWRRSGHRAGFMSVWPVQSEGPHSQFNALLFEILSNFWTRDTVFSPFSGPCKLCSQSCLSSSALEHSLVDGSGVCSICQEVLLYFFKLFPF